MAARRSAAGTAVAEAPKVEVPDLIRTPALDIGSEDVALPRIHISQFSSKAQQAGLVDPGVLYASVGQDDPDPVILESPLLFHILTLKRAKSYSEKGGDLERYEYNDPDAPPGAWVTYDYTMVLPAHDVDVPYKFLWTKSARPAAQQVNTSLVRHAAVGPPWELAFEVHTAERQNDMGKYWIPQVRLVEAKPENVKIAEALGIMMSSNVTEASSTGTQPDI